MTGNPHFINREEVTPGELFDIVKAQETRLQMLECVVAMLINLEMEARGEIAPPKDPAIVRETLRCLGTFVHDRYDQIAVTKADEAFLRSPE